MSTPGERLREERLRLGFNQERFAAFGGVRKQAQIKYEQGERKPDADYLEGIARAGADVAYILTGQPAVLRATLGDISLATQMAESLGGSKEEISRRQERFFQQLRQARAEAEEEESLLGDFRKCSAEHKQNVRQMTAALASASSNTAASTPADPARRSRRKVSKP